MFTKLFSVANQFSLVPCSGLLQMKLINTRNMHEFMSSSFCKLPQPFSTCRIHPWSWCFVCLIHDNDETYHDIRIDFYVLNNHVLRVGKENNVNDNEARYLSKIKIAGNVMAYLINWSISIDMNLSHAPVKCILSASLTSEKIPESWKVINMASIPKGGKSI